VVSVTAGNRPSSIPFERNVTSSVPSRRIEKDDSFGFKSTEYFGVTGPDPAGGPSSDDPQPETNDSPLTTQRAGSQVPQRFLVIRALSRLV
jgi:hypothetical protein